jgi:hypothetical protein
MLRFRQAVLAARDLDAAVQELRAALPLGEPYADPGVAYFGLRNSVMPLRLAQGQGRTEFLHRGVEVARR